MDGIFWIALQNKNIFDSPQSRGMMLYVIIVIIIIIVIMVCFKINALKSKLRNYLHLKTNNVRNDAHKASAMLQKVF